ncbi:MAG: hypothetical protein AABO58_25705 [Acidobacteriota bacterium]
MKRLGLFPLLALALACASGPAGPPKSPSVTIKQLSEVAALLNPTSTGLPVEYELEIVNPFDHPVTLTSIEVETVGVSGAYAMNRVKHAFAREIPPRAVDVVAFRAWVRPLQQADTNQSNSPVLMRGTARFKTADGLAMQSAFAARVQ